MLTIFVVAHKLLTLTLLNNRAKNEQKKIHWLGSYRLHKNNRTKRLQETKQSNKSKYHRNVIEPMALHKCANVMEDTFDTNIN